MTDERMDRIFKNGLDVNNRTIFFQHFEDEDSICSRFIDLFTKQMYVLENTNSKPITIVVPSSNGGCRTVGLGIYDVIKNCKCKTIIKATGGVFSAASFIFQAANVREMSKNCFMLIHRGEVICEDTVANAIEYTKQTEIEDVLIVDIYYHRMVKKNPKITKAIIKEKYYCDKDVWLSAKECLKVGLIDKIN